MSSERPDNPSHATDRLAEMLELFGREQRCYTSLIRMAKRLRQSIAAGDVRAADRILDEKHATLVEANHIERTLEPFKRDWMAIRRSLSIDERTVLDSALDCVEELLSELIDLERINERALAARLDASGDPPNRALAS